MQAPHLPTYRVTVVASSPQLGDVVAKPVTFGVAHVGIVTAVYLAVQHTSANNVNVATNDNYGWASASNAVYWRYILFYSILQNL